MAKKSSYSDDSFNDDADWAADEPVPFGDEPIDLIEADVRDICGKPNAARGSLLFGSGAVSQRSFDGHAIHATVSDGGTLLPVVFDLIDESSSCSDAKHARLADPNCEHIAALMYAYIRQPESFLPQNVGGFIDLLNENPQARDQLARDPQLNQMLEQIQSLPPAARAALDKLTLNATPEQMTPVAELNTPEEQLKSLMRNLSLEQLSEIAKRRGWKLSSNAKEALSEELALLLASAPLPFELSSEEEQLLRNENTLYGLLDTPGHSALQNLWRARAGGDMKRFDNAVRGLQSAGVMFPCTGNGSALHYHWSPFLRSEDAPHLAPKAKPYPAEKIERLKPAEPLMPLTTIVDAVLELAEREPLRVRLLKIDSRFANQPFAQGWELDPQELAQYAKTRFFATNSITITFPLFWTDETIQKLETLSPWVAQWIAAFIFGSKMLKQDGDYARIDGDQVETWRKFTDEARWEYLWQGWRAGGGGLYELRAATERAALTAQRSSYTTNFKPIDLLTEIMHARNFVARVLAPLDPLTWYSFKSLAEYVRGIRGDFLHTTTTQEVWFLAAKKTRHRFDPNHSQNWDDSYRAVLAAFLDTTLRWLGVTEVAYEGKDLAAFRITALGAALLSGGKVNVPTEPVDPNAPSITWLDEATIRLRATPDAARAMPLIRAFADPARESLTFRVANASIARAFERGNTVAEIAGKLAELNAPLPNALRAKMEALAANYGRAHVYEHLTVIELSDDLALRELLAGTTLGQFVVHQFSPRLVVVRDENVDDWVNEVVKKGYTPQVMTNDK
ncbi:MAG: helicase-associated domain-containing protein [Chloroflexi bacterium]|nr:helicase-associated domain-containing protein [Chloroflexota bacterium]